jgi:antitoxin YefM
MARTRSNTLVREMALAPVMGELSRLSTSPRYREPNWDTYGAAPLSREVISAVRQDIIAIYEKVHALGGRWLAPLDHVGHAGGCMSLLPNGGIQIQWVEPDPPILGQFSLVRRFCSVEWDGPTVESSGPIQVGYLAGVQHGAGAGAYDTDTHEVERVSIEEVGQLVYWVATGRGAPWWGKEPGPETGEEPGETSSGERPVRAIAISRARARLTQLPEELRPLGSVYAVVRHGIPVLAITSWVTYESLVETLEVTSDPTLMEAIAQGQQDIAAGRTIDLEDLLAKWEEQSPQGETQGDTQEQPQEGDQE